MADGTRDIKFIVMIDGKQYFKTAGEIDKAMNKMGQSAVKTGGNIKTGFDANMRRANITGMQFNRIVQDSPYFLSSMSMGIMSVSNNLPMLAESLAAGKREGVGFKDTLKGMVTGMNGWMMAINLGISAILAWSLASRGAKDDTSDLKDSANDLSKAFNKFVKIDNPFEDIEFKIKGKAPLEEIADETSRELRRLKKEQSDLNAIIEAGTFNWKDLSPTLQTVIKAYGMMTGSTDDIIRNAKAKLEVNKEEIAKTEQAVKTINGHIGALEADIDAYMMFKKLGLEETNKGIDKQITKVSDLTHTYNLLYQNVVEATAALQSLQARDIKATVTFDKDGKVVRDTPKSLGTVDVKPIEPPIDPEEIGKSLKDEFNKTFQHTMGLAHNFTNVIRIGLGSAGNKFVSAMSQALSLAQSIASIMRSLEMIGVVGNTISAVATAGASTGASAIMEGATSQAFVMGLGKQQQQPIIVEIGHEPIKRAVVSNYGTTRAKHKRFA